MSISHLPPSSQKALDEFNYAIDSEGNHGMLKMETSKEGVKITHVPNHRIHWYHKFFKYFGICGYDVKKIAKNLCNVGDVSMETTLKNLQIDEKIISSTALELNTSTKTTAISSDDDIQKLRKYLYTADNQPDKTIQNILTRLSQIKNTEYEYLHDLVTAKLQKMKGKTTEVEVKRFIEQAKEFGESPIHFAIRTDRADYVDSLIKNGYDVNATNNSGETPLHLAAMFGKTRAVEILVDLGANLEAKNKTGDTPLHLASTFGKTETVATLARCGADRNATNNLGDTPLHLAVWHDRVDCTEKLIEVGANLEAKNKREYTPLHVAIEHGIDCMKKLIDAKADLEAKDMLGNTPLHLAAEYGYTKCVHELIGYTANKNAKNKAGKTPLDLATEHNHADCIRELLNLEDMMKEMENLL